jgi:hypothetical protein
VTLLILSDQDSEPHTRTPVTLVAELMKANHFGLDVVLGTRRSGAAHCQGRRSNGNSGRSKQGTSNHSVLPKSFAPRAKYGAKHEPVVNITKRRPPLAETRAQSTARPMTARAAVTWRQTVRTGMPPQAQRSQACK